MSSEAAAAAEEDAVSPKSEDGGGVGAGFYDLCKVSLSPSSSISLSLVLF